MCWILCALAADGQTGRNSEKDAEAYKEQIDQIRKLRKRNPDSSLHLAIQFQKKALERKDKMGEALALYEIAESNQKLNKDELAIEQYLKASQWLKEVGLDSLSAGCLLDIGMVMTSQGNYPEAIRYCYKYLQRIQTMPLYRNGQLNQVRLNGMVSGYYFIWTNYYYTSRYKDGLPFLDTIEQIRKLQGRIEVNNMNNYGVTYSKLGMNDSALWYYQRGLRLAMMQKRPDLMVLFYSNLASIYEAKGQLGEAKKYYREQSRVADSINNMRMAADGQLSLARIYVLEGMYKEAIPMYEEALHLLEVYGSHIQYLNALQEFGKYYLQRGNVKEAEKYLNKARERADQSGNKESQVQILLELARLYQKQEAYEEAWSVLAKARYLSCFLPHGRYRSQAALGICNVLLRSGTVNERIHEATVYKDSSEYLYREITGYAVKDTDQYLLASVYSSRARYEFQKGHMENSSSFLQQAMNIWRALGATKELAEDMEECSFVWEALHQPDSALFYARQFNKVKNVLNDEQTLKDVKELETRFETRQKEQQILLLDRENKLARLELQNRMTELREQRLRSFLQESRMKGMEQENDIKELHLKKAKHELEMNTMLLGKKEKEKQLWKKESELRLILIKQHKLIRNILLLFSLLLVLTGWFLFYRYKARQDLRESADRQRISSDLHDELGSTLSSIRMYSAFALEQHANGKKESVEEILKIITDSSGEMIDDMNDIVWAINPMNDSLKSMAERLQSFGWKLAQSQGIRFSATLPEEKAETELPVSVRRNLYLMTKELITNAVRHSEAEAVTMEIQIDHKRLLILVSDNGKGMQWPPAQQSRLDGGNGLSNLQVRSQEIGAQLTVETAPGGGTCVQVVYSLS